MASNHKWVLLWTFSLSLLLLLLLLSLLLSTTTASPPPLRHRIAHDIAIERRPLDVKNSRLYGPEGGSPKNKRRRRRRRRERQTAGSFDGSSVSAMLPRAFVPPSGSSFCHNDVRPESVHFYYCGGSVMTEP
ncbi:hypothetical protein QJS10_CPB14g00462 [Acorus calamus]|uniref:Uncharacterized protein n=1 Tax=Acorus calamus TaxID=4465 RepID=A0AAV9DEH6_ACOCL|nr:hypothetical protein QJS10_CPB14g00462 [Acorus calamus]